MKISSVIGLVVVAVVVLRAAYDFIQKQLNEAASTPPGLPPAQPRRVRRGQRVAPPMASEPESVTAPSAPHLDASDMQVTRAVRAQPRMQFRGPAALRQAIVAREVLGLPLSLRPPRF